MNGEMLDVGNIVKIGLMAILFFVLAKFLLNKIPGMSTYAQIF